MTKLKVITRNICVSFSTSVHMALVGDIASLRNCKAMDFNFAKENFKYLKLKKKSNSFRPTTSH